MKTIKYIIFFLVMMGGYSCMDPSYADDIFIRNNSNHKIVIYLYNSDVDGLEPIVLDIGDFTKNSNSSRAGFMASPPPFMADSLHVVFNDTVSITHFYEVIEEDVRRNMFSSDFWNSQLSEYRNQYDYFFTDADYEEALEKE